MLQITEDSTRADLIEALLNLSHDAGRVTIADPKHKALHDDINRLLDHYELADH